MTKKELNAWATRGYNLGLAQSPTQTRTPAAFSTVAESVPAQARGVFFRSWEAGVTHRWEALYAEEIAAEEAA
jgi:hypothetical protein